MKPRCMFVANYTPHCSLWDMGRDIRTALEIAGVSVMEYLRSDFQNDAMGKVMVKALVDHAGPKFFLDMNANEHYRVGDRTLFDAYGIPRVTFLTDSPLRHMSKIRAMPDQALVGVVDGDFGEILTDYGLPQKAFPFAHAGPPPIADPLPDEKRTIRVLFAGNIGAPPTIEEFLDRHAGQDPTKRKIISGVVDAAFETVEGFYPLCRAALPDAALDEIQALGQDLETLVIARRRADLLKSLAGSGAVVCGEVHSSIRRDLPDDLTYRGALTFEDILDLMERSRVLINSSPSFRNGAHERVFYGLSRGAKVMTEPTRFFDNRDVEGLGLAMLPFDLSGFRSVLGDALDGAGQGRAGQERAGQERADRMAHYARTHSWAQRIPALMEAVRPLWAAQ